MIPILLVCSLGLAGLATALWALERHRHEGGRINGPGAAAPRSGRARAAVAPVPAAGHREDQDCLCNQCEQAPACALTYPDCVRVGADAALDG